MVKRRQLEKILRKNGWFFLRHGGDHDIWTNGQIKTQIPRHRIISDRLYVGLIKQLNLNRGDHHAR